MSQVNTILCQSTLWHGSELTDLFSCDGFCLIFFLLAGLTINLMADKKKTQECIWSLFLGKIAAETVAILQEAPEEETLGKTNFRAEKSWMNI